MPAAATTAFVVLWAACVTECTVVDAEVLSTAQKRQAFQAELERRGWDAAAATATARERVAATAEEANDERLERERWEALERRPERP